MGFFTFHLAETSIVRKFPCKMLTFAFLPPIAYIEILSKSKHSAREVCEKWEMLKGIGFVDFSTQKCKSEHFVEAKRSISSFTKVC